MTNGGDAAEQVVRLSLEGFEVAAKLSGAAAKNIAVLLVSVLKQEQKTKGKARLTNMIKSGKELKVFSIPNKDLKKFTEQAKRYGVLYCVLRDKNTKGDNVPIDIIARAEDASKIQRIVERFELGKVDKAAIVTESQKAVEKPPSVRGPRVSTPFSTVCGSPERGGFVSGFPHFNKPCLSCYFVGLHGVFHSFNMVFHISTVERCRKPVQNVEKARRSPPRWDFLRFVQSCFTRCSFFGSML